MPNWCNNNITVTHTDPAVILKLVDSINEGKFFDHICPVPTELMETTSGFFGDDERQTELVKRQMSNTVKYGYKDWYDFCTSEWGTKWDAGQADLDILDDNTISLCFDTAWSPPIELYNKMMEQGYSVEAYYYEPGMAFVGHYEDGDDECYEIPGNSNEVVERIPKYLDEMFAISESMEQWEEDE